MSFDELGYGRIRSVRFTLSFDALLRRRIAFAGLINHHASRVILRDAVVQIDLNSVIPDILPQGNSLLDVSSNHAGLSHSSQCFLALFVPSTDLPLKREQ